jgi:flagellar hook protein FlgE
VNGVLDTIATVTDVQLPIGTLLNPVATTGAALGGNVPSRQPLNTPFTQKITTYDAKGAAHTSTFTFTKTANATATAPDAWTVTAGEADGPAAASLNITFAGDGKLNDPATGLAPVPADKPITFTYTGAGGNTVTVDMTAITQFGGANTAAVLSQNGSTMGTLQSYSIAPDGTVNGVFSNGLKQPLAQLALVAFNNPGGLEKVGNTMFRSTVNSGTERIGTAGTGGRGLLAGGVTEMSNVDLAAEFTSLIISQRGFQANSRVITASDEILQDLVNMKR